MKRFIITLAAIATVTFALASTLGKNGESSIKSAAHSRAAAIEEATK